MNSLQLLVFAPRRRHECRGSLTIGALLRLAPSNDQVIDLLGQRQLLQVFAGHADRSYLNQCDIGSIAKLKADQLRS